MTCIHRQQRSLNEKKNSEQHWVCAQQKNSKSFEENSDRQNETERKSTEHFLCTHTHTHLGAFSAHANCKYCEIEDGSHNWHLFENRDNARRAADSKSICDIHKSVCNMHGWLSFTYTQPNQVQTCDFLLNFFLFVGSSCMAYPCFRIWAMMREKLETSGNNASTFIGGKTI